MTWRMVKWGTAAALSAVVATWMSVHGMRVPFTTACFQPDDNMRAACLVVHDYITDLAGLPV